MTSNRTETGITKNAIIQQLTRSPHGDLKQYTAPAQAAAKQEAEFLAHLIAWNQQNGQIRDSKVALPIITLSVPNLDREFVENSLAHLALLDPRNLVRALDFAYTVKTPTHGRALRKLVARYLQVREAEPSWWIKTAIQHRSSFKTLYARYHVKPGRYANDVLFKGQKLGVFKDIAELKNMAPKDAAATIIQRRIPFLVATGALGDKAKDPDLVLALIEQMSPQELVNHTKMLERLGVRSNPALRAAFDAGLIRAAKSKKATFKATRAVDAVQDEHLKEKLRGVQEKQISALGGVDGNWLVLADKSGSMQSAIELAIQLSSTLAKMVKGQVHLVFFDTTPRHVNATGKEYDTLLKETRHITANGGTSIGCGLRYALDKGLEVDGIAVVSDGGENNTPYFHTVYPRYVERFGKEPPVYFYSLAGQSNDDFSQFMSRAGLDMQTFDLRKGFDYYSLPNIVATMKTSRYGLVDQIMSVPLLTLDQVFSKKQSSH